MRLLYIKKHQLFPIYILVGLLFSSCESNETENIGDIIPIDSCNTDSIALASISFLAIDNPEYLIYNVEGEIIGDSIVECWNKSLMTSKILRPRIMAMGGAKILLDNIDYREDQYYDFSKPVELTLQKGFKQKKYKIYFHAFTGLPIIKIETKDGVDITSKEEYVDAHFTLIEDVITRNAGDKIETEVQIKGRGNATWLYYPKKPYRLKFKDKISLLGEKADKSWVLLANYCDKTMLHNQIASILGKMSNLEYTPSFHFVELFLNGRYWGTYQLGEKLKISKHRVNVGDNGFLLELDRYAPEESDSRYFIIEHLPQPVNIKDPDVEYDDVKFNFIKDYLIKADSVLFSENFKDPNEGWQKYLDRTSFVDWFVVNEICKSIDAFRSSSNFMNISEGGKLKMGPLWDYDHSFGSYIREGVEFPYGFWVRNSLWYSRLYEDPAFVDAVRERFDYFYNRKEYIYNEINNYASYLKYSVIENNNKWGTMYKYVDRDVSIWGCYENEIEYLKEWLSARFEWLKVNL